MGWLPRGLAMVTVGAAVACSVFPDSPPQVGRPSMEGGAGGTGGSEDGSSGGAAGAADASVESGKDGSAETGAGGEDAGALERVYVAVVADCLEEVSATNTPNPDACAAYASGMDGPNELWVDLRKGGRRKFTGYLRFDVDDKLAGHTLLGARVEITVTTFANAVGSAPELWECAPFSRASLFVQAPALIGSAALAPAPGPVTGSERVSYALPVGAVLPSAPSYLALVPAVVDGSGFWNLMGPEPPRLLVTYR